MTIMWRNGLILCLLLAMSCQATDLNCPTSCHCITTPEGLHKASCSSLPDLNKFSSRNQHHNINILQLSHRNITKIGENLDRFTEVVTIDLSFNAIAKLERFLQNSKKLVHVNLRRNLLNSFSSKALPVSVSSLDLRDNRLIDVPRNLHLLKDLEHLELNGNPIRCSCDNLKLLWELKTKGIVLDQVKCHLPKKVRGQMWNHLKVSEVCNEKKSYKENVKHSVLLEDMMMGDQPIDDAENVIPETTHSKSMPITALSDLEQGQTWEGSGSDLDEDDNEFLRVTPGYTEKKSSTIEPDTGSGDFDSDLFGTESSGDKLGELSLNSVNTTIVNATDLEGSGDVGSGVDSRSFSNATNYLFDNATLDFDDYDFEGSGDELDNVSTTTELFITGLFHGFFLSKDSENNSTTSEPFELPPKPTVFLGGNVDWDADPTDEVSTAGAPVIEEPIVVKNRPVVENPRPSQESVNQEYQEEPKESKEPVKTTVATYVCIAVLITLLVGLIGFTIFKNQLRKKRDRRLMMRQNKKDVENAGKEMVDMNKALLGKPVTVPVIEKERKVNGNTYEPVPLHDPKKRLENGSADKRKSGTDSLKKSNPNLQTTPNTTLSNGSRPEQNGSRPEQNGRQPVDSYDGQPKVDLVPLKSEPEDHLINRNGLNGHPEKDYLPLPQETMPMYPPDSGRVRIKLTETPKPKTPTLVTRSRSNAGDIIITPAADQSPVHKNAT